jgi:hypothetical protein
LIPLYSTGYKSQKELLIRRMGIQPITGVASPYSQYILIVLHVITYSARKHLVSLKTTGIDQIAFDRSCHFVGLFSAR